MLEAGYAVAREQFVLNPYTFPTVDAVTAATPDEKDNKGAYVQKVSKDEMVACVTLSAGKTSVTFNRWTGWIDYLDVDGKPMLEEGYAIRPEFWRAPTDNDYGAKIQNKLRAWKNPEMKLKSFDVAWSEKDSEKHVTAVYEMPSVKAELTMTYVLTAGGELIVTEKMTVDKNAEKMPELLRYGMQLVMPPGIQHGGILRQGTGRELLRP